MGGGLVSEMAAAGVLSPEQAERQRREDEREAERERRRVELDAEQRAEVQAERVFELSRQGYTPMTVGERLGLMASMDVREQRKIARRRSWVSRWMTATSRARFLSRSVRVARPGGMAGPRELIHLV